MPYVTVDSVEPNITAGPVLESLMSMKHLPSATASALQGGSLGGSARGQSLKRVQEGAEDDSSGDEEDPTGDKLSPIPSVTHPRGAQVCFVASYF